MKVATQQPTVLSRFTPLKKMDVLRAANVRPIVTSHWTPTRNYLSAMFLLSLAMFVSTASANSRINTKSDAVPSSTDVSLGSDEALNTTLDSARCRHGRLSSAHCLCYPCWQGSDCDTYVDNYAPRFLVHKATAVVPENVTGSTYRAWATDEDLGLTCPLGPGEAARCPCAAFTYQLFSPAGDHRFSLHPSTGLLVRREGEGRLREGHTYLYKLMVQSELVPGYSKERLYDILDLEIYVGPSTLQKYPWI